MINTPVAPHPIEVTVNDTDNSTVKANVRVYIRNITKKSTLDKDTNGNYIVTNSAGLALLDAANLPITTGQALEYQQGDKVLIVAYEPGKTHDAVLYTISGDSKTQTLNLNPVPHAGPSVYSTQRILTIVGGNTTGTVYYAKVYALDDGQLLSHIEVPANDTRTASYGDLRGIGASGGFVIERENSGLLVTASVK